jgi:hypothetical protein
MDHRPRRPNGNFASSSKALINEQAARRKFLLNHAAAGIALSIELPPTGLCTVPLTKDGHSNREFRWAKALQHPLNQTTVSRRSRVEAHDLIASIAETILRCVTWMVEKAGPWMAFIE